MSDLKSLIIGVGKRFYRVFFKNLCEIFEIFFQKFFFNNISMI